MTDSNQVKNVFGLMLCQFSFEAVVACLADACREQADLQLGRFDNQLTAAVWEMRAQRLEEIGND